VTAGPRETEGGREQRAVPDWDDLWNFCPEADSDVYEIEGAVPSGLVGTLYRNGPGKYDLSSNFLSGDGLIRRLSFAADGRVRYTSRYVQTRKYEAEVDANRPKLRTAGTQLPGGPLANAFRMPAAEANTHVTLHAGKLHALHEGGPPVELDPETLATIGDDTFDGALSRRTLFSAHPHYDPHTGDMYTFGVDPTGRTPMVRTYRWTKDGALENIRDFSIPYFSFLHDFAVTQDWLVFIIPPLKASIFPSMLGFKSFFDSFKVLEGRGSHIYLVPKNGDEIVHLEVDPVYVAHVIAARDEGDDVVVDFVRPMTLDRMFDELREFRTSGFDFIGGSGGAWRYRFDPRRRHMQCEQLDDRPQDFPRYDERLPMHEARYSYIGANHAAGVPGLYRGLLKFDLQTGESDFFDPGPHHVTQEPLFVPDPAGNAEDDGWLIAYVHDGERPGTDVCVFDARRVSDGPICSMKLPAFSGMTFHGSWVGA
jgi:all-trans-8'-apo-beta-carotenal 15,15'-oxygenase